MARADVAPEDRDKAPLQLEQMVDCDECSTTFDVVFTAPDGVFDKEDLYEPPTMDVTCPNPECGHTWHAEYEGWTVNDEA